MGRSCIFPVFGRRMPVLIADSNGSPIQTLRKSVEPVPQIAGGSLPIEENSLCTANDNLLR
jgi:hypothetical protein